MHAQKIEGKFGYTVKLWEGNWHVVASSFKIWTSGKYSNPGNEYSNFKVKNKKLRFDDMLTFYKGEKKMKLPGKLVQKNPDKLDYIWHGKGLFFWMKSKWKVVASDADGQWVVLYSTKTAMSPQGMDIMSRRKNMSEKEIKDILSHVDKIYIKKEPQILK